MQNFSAQFPRASCNFFEEKNANVAFRKMRFPACENFRLKPGYPFSHAEKRSLKSLGVIELVLEKAGAPFTHLQTRPTPGDGIAEKKNDFEVGKCLRDSGDLGFVEAAIIGSHVTAEL